MRIEFIVSDMTCSHCVQTITQAVQACEPGAQVTAATATHRVTVDSVQNPAAVEAAIRDAGYSPVAA